MTIQLKKITIPLAIQIIATCTLGMLAEITLISLRDHHWMFYPSSFAIAAVILMANIVVLKKD